VLLCFYSVLRLQERKQQHDPPGTYEGQTALHIAIVNRDFDMVKFLVQVSGKFPSCGCISLPVAPMQRRRRADMCNAKQAAKAQN
jgi:ankyrin repeat protein